MNPLSVILITVILTYAGVLAGLWLFQRKLIYHPQRKMPSPEAVGLHNAGNLRLKTRDGEELEVWYLRTPADTVATMLYLHGNAGHLADRAEKLDAFRWHGFDILAVSYRGYGNSSGSPSEAGLYEDARTALEFLYGQGIVPKEILYYGESLGSGVAVQLASEKAPGMLVLEAPFTSVRARAQELYPLIPVGLLLDDHFDSLSKIAGITAPLLVFHGELDAVIPIVHGRRILEAVPGTKKGVFFPEVGHTEFDYRVLAKNMRAYWEEQYSEPGMIDVPGDTIE